jgi:carboxymethylenebutenolidase
MTPLQRYIAEEIATDHVQGLLTRREALRRLGLLGMTTAAASALIAACGDNKASDPVASSSGRPAPNAKAPGMETAIATTPIAWPGPHGELQGAWAAANTPRGAVLVIHENKGLNDWVRSVAARLAGIGYSALAVDLLSEEGGTASFEDQAAATAALAKISPDRFVADLKSGLEVLERWAPGTKIAAVGFCFGGGLVWQLLAAGESRIAAAVPFYGPLPDNPDFSRSKGAAVLGFYGALDQRVTSSEPAAKVALDRAGLVSELVVEPAADHAFFNDTGARYNATAAGDAWQRLQDWFSTYLA